MKITINLYKYMVKWLLRNKVTIISLLLCLGFSIMAGVYALKEMNDELIYPIAIINEDTSSYSNTFLEKLEQDKMLNILYLDKETALRQVSTGRIDGVLIIKDNFSSQLEKGEYDDILEIISPISITSIQPISEIISMTVIDIWLDREVDNTLLSKYQQYDGKIDLTYEELIKELYANNIEEDILLITHISSNLVVKSKIKNPLTPYNKAIGIFAGFALFVMILSSEWVFSLKNKSLSDRFTSMGISFFRRCLSSLLANISVFMIFYIILIITLSVIIGGLTFLNGILLIISMLIYLIGISAMALIVATFVSSINHLIIIGATITIINLSLTPLTIDVQNEVFIYSTIAKVLPGTYLLSSSSNSNGWIMLLIVSIIWLILAYVIAYIYNKLRNYTKGV